VLPRAGSSWIMLARGTGLSEANTMPSWCEQTLPEHKPEPIFTKPLRVRVLIWEHVPFRSQWRRWVAFLLWDGLWIRALSHIKIRKFCQRFLWALCAHLYKHWRSWAFQKRKKTILSPLIQYLYNSIRVIIHL
jgi:hypothetical protein